jgi:hypothetical protein
VEYRPAESQLHVLIIHRRDATDGYAAYLSSEGFRTGEATDSDDGVAKALVLMPDFLSSPSQRWMKSRSKAASSGWEALLATLGDEAAGCDVVLEKPCSPTLLVSTIQRLLVKRFQSTLTH